MNTNKVHFGSLVTSQSFQICLVLGLVLLALLAAYVSDLSPRNLGHLAGRRTPMPSLDQPAAEMHLAGRRTPMPSLDLPDSEIHLAGRRPPMPVV